MSHVTTVKVKISNLDALEAACKELGVQFVRGQTTYKWYGRHVGDYPLPDGFKASDMGKCNHVVKVPNVQYEVGVVQLNDGSFTLLYDFWGPGQGLLQKFGPDCQRLTQMYAKHAAIQEFQNQGYSVEELPEENGNLQFVVTPF